MLKPWIDKETIADRMIEYHYELEKAARKF